MLDIKIVRTTEPKAKPQDESKLGFGSIFTDHMFVMNYDEGQGWHDARIVPYGPIPLEPSAMCLHYGQADFEGMKAYRTESGRIQLFRPEQNMARMNVSNDRLCIPQIDEAFGTGTAAVISPIGELKYGDKIMTLNNGEIGPVSHMLYEPLTGIQWGKTEDTFGGTVPVAE